jgi:hypothetical protein
VVSSDITGEAPSTQDRVGEVLERAAAFYERFLLDSAIGESVRSRLGGGEIGPETLRDFQVGYAPDDWSDLLDELRRDGCTDEELVVAGIASKSQRGNIHTRLRSRITFPVRDAGGRLLGFAGLATNPGPSWPEWLTTVEGERFRRSHVLFGLDRAADPIVAADGALVARDPVEVLRLHQHRRLHAVSTVRSEFGLEHLAQLAVVLHADPADLQVIGSERSDGGGLAIRRRAAGGSRAQNRLISARRQFHVGRMTPGRIRPDPIRRETGRSWFLLQVSRLLLGAAIPLGWLAVFQPHGDTSRAGVKFVAAVACVPVTYVLLLILASWISGRIRRRSRARRMRSPWEYGSTEWQPPTWTYHRFEDVLIGAAPVSVVVLVALFAVVFGFAA